MKTDILSRLPDPVIIKKLQAYIPDAGSQIFICANQVQDRLHKLENDARAENRRALFWRGVLDGVGSLAFIFEDTVYKPLQRPSVSTLFNNDFWRVGHCMRCAIRIVMDRHGLNSRDMNLTRRERHDLNSFTDSRYHGSPLLGRIRREMGVMPDAAKPHSRAA